MWKRAFNSITMKSIRPYLSYYYFQEANGAYREQRPSIKMCPRYYSTHAKQLSYFTRDKDVKYLNIYPRGTEICMCNIKCGMCCWFMFSANSRYKIPTQSKRIPSPMWQSFNWFKPPFISLFLPVSISLSLFLFLFFSLVLYPFSLH